MRAYLVADAGTKRCIIQDHGFRPTPKVTVDDRTVDQLLDAANSKGCEVSYRPNFMMHNRYYEFLRELCVAALGGGTTDAIEFHAKVYVPDDPV